MVITKLANSLLATQLVSCSYEPEEKKKMYRDPKHI